MACMPKFSSFLTAIALLIMLGGGLGGPTTSPATAGPVRELDNAAATPDPQTNEIIYPAELVALAPPEHFVAENLFEIINGDADLYLKAGFVRLETRRFSLKPEPQEHLEIFIYQMVRHRSAFAVYSVRRGEEARPSPLTRFAHRYRNGLFLVHGPYYVEMRATEESPPMVAAMNDLAKAFMQAREIAAEPIPELNLFPSEGLLPGSLALHPANAFGFDGFTDLFTARYRLIGKPATAFLRPCPSPGAAADLAADYQAFLAAYDGVAAPADHQFPEGRLIRLMDTYTLVFVHGNTVAGVHGAATPKLAVRLARALQARLALEEKK